MIQLKAKRDCQDFGRFFRKGQLHRIGGNVLPWFKNWEIVSPEFDLKYSEVPRDYSGKVTLIGSGPSKQEAFDNPPEGMVAVLNDEGHRYPHKVDFWFTLHCEKMANWIEQRLATGKTMDGVKVVLAQLAYIPHHFYYSPDFLRGGSSGLYALETLANMGFDHIHCTGIDLGPDPKYHVFRFAWKNLDLGKVKVTTNSEALKKFLK